MFEGRQCPLWMIPWQELSDVSTLVRSLSGLLVRDARTRQKPGLLPLSAFGALFVSAARMIPGHPGVAAFRKSAKKDAFLKGS
jgi:hypothetical protein